MFCWEGLSNFDIVTLINHGGGCYCPANPLSSWKSREETVLFPLSSMMILHGWVPAANDARLHRLQINSTVSDDYPLGQIGTAMQLGHSMRPVAFVVCLSIQAVQHVDFDG